MADASNAQTSFLGGEFSPNAQGRFDDPDYKKGMNVCRNVLPIETGAATRRPGTRFLDYTRCGQTGKMVAFSFSQNAPYTMEFTDGKLRFRDSFGLVKADEPRNVVYISEDTPAQLITSPGCAGYADWAAGDTVMFNFQQPGASVASGALVSRQFTLVAGADQKHWTLYDSITGQALDGTTVQWNNTLAIQVARIFELPTVYKNGAWAALRGVQNDDSVLLLHPFLPPYVVFAPIDGGNQFTITAAQFIDGPYLDPPTDGSFLTTSGVSGIVNMVIDYPAWDATVTYPDASRFVASTTGRSGATGTAVQYKAGGIVKSGGLYYVSIKDTNLNHAPPNATYWTAVPAAALIGLTGLTSLDVGRSVRLLAQPATWAAGTAYTANQLVTYQGAYYTALVGSTGKVPGLDAVNWGVASNAAQWTWGIITAVSGAGSFSLSIQGDPLLYNANVTLYRLGVYSNSTAWPSCGTFHDGRFWLGGAMKNRFDASALFGNSYEFTPTSPDGTVTDANGISYTFRSKQQNQIMWMEPDHQGIIMGTAQGEWLVRASANDDPLTPTNIQGHNVSNIGSANIEPMRLGISLGFVQRYGRKLVEYVCDLFSGKFSGLNLTERAKHLTGGGIGRLAYQQELVPVVWAATQDKKLIGTTYKRESAMISQPPVFNAWHRHDLGSTFDVIDIVGGASPDGLLDTVTLMTQDTATGICRVEAITELFDETATLDEAWFVDDGVIPLGEITNVNGTDGVKLSGLAQLEGKTISVFLAELDCGDYTVSGGQVFVPYGADPDKLFTLAYIQSLNREGYEYEVRLKSTAANPNAQTMMEFPEISGTYLSHVTYLNYGSQAITDWAHDRVTFMLPGPGPYAGLVQYKISTGALVKYAKIDEIFGGVCPPYYDAALAYGATPMVLGSDNKIYTALVSQSFNVDPTSAGQLDWTNTAQPQNLPAAYNGATTYAAGAYITSGGVIYQSLQNANTGHAPASSPTWWLVMFNTPPAWSASTVYGNMVSIIGSNDHVYYALKAVPPGQGDPTSFATNNNPYWATRGAIWGPIISTAGLGLDYNGDIFMFNSGQTFSYVKIDGVTLKVKGHLSALGGDSVPSPAGGVVPLSVLNNSLQLEAPYILETVNTTPSGSTAPAAVLINANSLLADSANTFIFDEGNSPVACAGSSGVGLGQAYVLTRPLAGNATTAAVGLYEISAFSQKRAAFKFRTPPVTWRDANRNIYGNKPPSGSTLRKCGTISPNAIDPLWTFFTDFSGLLYDPQDGNVITFVGTQNPATWNALTVYAIGTTLINYALGSDNNVYKATAAGTLPDPVTDGGAHWTLIRAKAQTTYYMIKLSSDCARVMWTCAVAAAPTNALSTQFVDISSGTYVFLESLGLGNWQVRSVDTLTGKSTIQFPTQQGLAQLGGAQVYNSKTGDVIIYPQYDSSVGGVTAPPTRVNPVGGATAVSFTGWGRWNVPPNPIYKVPGVVGFTYTSQGQTLRPVSPQESGARNGPAFGKTRRNHRYAAAVANTIGIKFGSDLSETMRPAAFKSRKGKGALLLTAAVLYTGEHSDTIEGDYDLDGMLAWQVTRPYPATVTALGGFLQTQDR